MLLRVAMDMSLASTTPILSISLCTERTHIPVPLIPASQ